ncbi:TVP38/TMEM64 family protein [Bacillus sp. HMF5848]|uniref:TVP38/TMEM64 family protein n=1 Tax=Bacillus sp. HMF5848 TaxID=2495421 RepID=UPI000F794E3D|nr:TVP38/TMEM64 family protein [Bacillus sp. HMF5848]RSK29069.1 TVP38/TMEM64 family protein [Bacillus sp. HMF5848]
MAKQEKKGGALKLLAVVAAIAVVFFIAWKTGILNQLKDVEAMQAWFEGFGVLGYIIFILVFIAVAVFMLPASLLTIVAGITFGSVKGGLLALIGATLGAMAAFLIAKYVARKMIVEKFQDNAIFKKIDVGVEKNGVSFLILSRLVPVFPYNVQNYAYGVTSIPFMKYSLVSLVTMAPGAFIYAFMAGQIVTEGMSFKLLIQFALAGIILFLVSLIPKYIAKKKGINMADLKG